MPIKRELYPANWNELSKQIRFERANNCCERCGVPNGVRIARGKQYPREWIIDDGQCYRLPNGDAVRPEVRDSLYRRKVVKVVLTVAHLDQDTTNNEPGNLAALCQRCHFLHDLPFNIVRRSHTKTKKERQRAAAAGQIEMEL